MSSTSLQRQLGLWTTVSVVAGSVIGSSIFMKPATMAGQVGSPILLLFVWIVAGIISMFGAMINAEIGSMMPVTGGQYVFFKKMYGEKFAFLYGWSAFAVINTAAVAAIAYVFAQYTEYFIELPKFSTAAEQSFKFHIPFIGDIFPLQNFGTKMLTIVLILLLTLANYISVKFSGKLQVFFSALKVAALLLLVGMIFFSGKGSFQNLVHSDQPLNWTSWITIAGCIAAVSGAFAAYDGWNNIGFIAGEIKNPSKNIPHGLFIGLSICILMYVLTNMAYLYMLPVGQMKNSALVATDAVLPIAGAAGAGLIACMVLISTFGAVNGNILACARVTYSMAEDKVFFPAIGEASKKYKTPGRALWLHGIWSVLFVISGTFDMLTDMFVFMSWFFYLFAAYGIFILRKKMPDAERPYRVWGYPVIPIIFILFTAVYLAVTVYTDITNYNAGKVPVINSVFGIVISLLGFPLYWYLKRKSRS
jgi:basic amino acid/polyamine antiporter, APA family